MSVSIHDNVTVTAVFSGRQIIPRSFFLDGKTFTVDQVERQWIGTHHQEPLYYFSVIADGSPYTLCFQPQRIMWLMREG